MRILGIGPVTSCGNGIGALEQILSGTAQPAREIKEIATPTGRAELPVYTAGAAGLENFAPRRSLRRMDGFTRKALLAAYLAVEDSGVELKDKTRVGVVFGSAYGMLEASFAFQDTIIEDGDADASPTLFASSVHGALASGVSMRLGIQGPTATVTNFDRTCASVFETAQCWLANGDVDYVLAGCGDEYHPVAGYAAAALRGNCRYEPGEGFVAFLLQKETAAEGYANLSFQNTREQISAGRTIFMAGGAISKQSESGSGDTKNTVCQWAPFLGSFPTAPALAVALAAAAMRRGEFLQPQTQDKTIPDYGIDCPAPGEPEGTLLNIEKT